MSLSLLTHLNDKIGKLSIHGVRKTQIMYAIQYVSALHTTDDDNDNNDCHLYPLQLHCLIGV